MKQSKRSSVKRVKTSESVRRENRVSSNLVAGFVTSRTESNEDDDDLDYDAILNDNNNPVSATRRNNRDAIQGPAAAAAVPKVNQKLRPVEPATSADAGSAAPRRPYGKPSSNYVARNNSVPQNAPKSRASSSRAPGAALGDLYEEVLGVSALDRQGGRGVSSIEVKKRPPVESSTPTPIDWNVEDNSVVHDSLCDGLSGGYTPASPLKLSSVNMSKINNSTASPHNLSHTVQSGTTGTAIHTLPTNTAGPNAMHGTGAVVGSELDEVDGFGEEDGGQDETYSYNEYNVEDSRGSGDDSRDLREVARQSSSEPFSPDKPFPDKPNAFNRPNQAESPSSSSAILPTNKISLKVTPPGRDEAAEGAAEAYGYGEDEFEAPTPTGTATFGSTGRRTVAGAGPRLASDHSEDTPESRPPQSSSVRAVSAASAAPAVKTDSASVAGLLREGAAVEANFDGQGNWYPGHVSKVNEDGTVDIVYDDGDSEEGVLEINVRTIGVDGLPATATVAAPVVVTPHVKEPERANMGSSSGDNSITLGKSNRLRFVVNEDVEGNFDGAGQWFPGKISQSNKDGTYDIAYDDGDSESGVPSNCIRKLTASAAVAPSVPESRVIQTTPAAAPSLLLSPTVGATQATPAAVILSLNVGDMVECNYDGAGQWFPGKISQTNKDGTYDIAYDDGDSESGVQIKNVRRLDSMDSTALGDTVAHNTAAAATTSSTATTAAATTIPASSTPATAEVPAVSAPVRPTPPTAARPVSRGRPTVGAAASSGIKPVSGPATSNSTSYSTDVVLARDDDALVDSHATTHSTARATTSVTPAAATTVTPTAATAISAIPQQQASIGSTHQKSAMTSAPLPPSLGTPTRPAAVTQSQPVTLGDSGTYDDDYEAYEGDFECEQSPTVTSTSAVHVQHHKNEAAAAPPRKLHKNDNDGDSDYDSADGVHMETSLHDSGEFDEDVTYF